jgi:hypothetical protein
MTADYASHYDHLAISAPDSLVVHFRKAYTLHKEVCEQPDRKTQLERQMGQILGGRVRIDMAVMADTEQWAPPPPPSMFQLMREKESHPWVRQAVDLFDAEVTKVDVPRGSRGSGTPAD